MHSKNLPNISNESKILLLCSRLEIGDEDKEILLNILKKDINWQAVLKYANFHRVTCLLYKNLSKIDFDGKEIINTWQGYYEYFLSLNQEAQNKLSLILNELKQKNIKIIIRKGLELIKLVYKDLGLRPTGDVDVLVRPQDWKEISDTLENAGLTSDVDLLKIHNLSAGRLYYHILYYDKIPEKSSFLAHNPYCLGYIKYFRLEPRLKLYHFDFYKPSIDEIWKDAIIFSSDGMDALMLSHEDMIMDLCFNLSKYNFFRLLCVCDINEFILKHKNDINWDLLVAKSNQRYLNPITYSGLMCAKRLFDTPIPTDLIKNLKPTKRTTFLLKKLNPEMDYTEQTSEHCRSYVPNEIRFLLITYRLANISMLIKISVFFLKSILPSPKFLSYRYNITMSPQKILSCYLKRIKKTLSKFIRK